jgi:hypothetical protein
MLVVLQNCPCIPVIVHFRLHTQILVPIAGILVRDSANRLESF